MQQLADSQLDLRADFPIFSRRGQSARLPRLGRDIAEAPRGARRARAPARVAQRERSPRRLPARAGGRRGLRSGPRERSRRSPERTSRARSSRRTRPRRLNLVAYSYGSREPRPRRRGAGHRRRAPRKLRAVAAGLRGDRRDPAPHPGRRPGELPLAQLDRELERGDVRIVAFAHVWNVLGTINPVAEICRRVRDAGAISVVDGAQAVPQLPVDVAGDRTPTSTPGPVTRRSVRPASASCTADRSCSRRCRRSSPAAT